MCAASHAVFSPSASPASAVRRARPTRPHGPRRDSPWRPSCGQPGIGRSAGVDEVGRGPWAGPVVAAAVILPPDPDALAPLLGQVDDSKRLAPSQRERLFNPIQQLALATGVGRVEAGTIDRVGIAAATRQAMRQALAELAVQPDFALIDYLTLPDLPLPHAACRTATPSRSPSPPLRSLPR